MATREMAWKSKLRWGAVKVKENMSRDVKTVEAETCIMDAARLMRDQSVGCVLVKEDGRMVGIITDRDITCRVTASGRDPGTTTAKTIMTGDVGHCFEDDSLAEAARIMIAKRARRLPVFNRAEDLVGVLTADDLAWHTDHTLAGEVIEDTYHAHE